MAKEIELDEKDCSIFQGFIEGMYEREKALKVTEFEVKRDKTKRKYEIEFEVL